MVQSEQMESATDQIRKDWDSQAPNWYEQRQSLLRDSLPVHEWLVEQLAPKDGQRILEIAAGTGDTGLLAAPRLGSGRLLSTDISPDMVQAARKRGAELGIHNADYRVLDGQAMDLPDASFDGVICRWGFMLMPDLAAALRECRRVLVPGGRLVFAVFTSQEENPWAAIPAKLIAKASPPTNPASGWQPGIFALADRSHLQELLDNAGYTSSQIEAVDMTWTFHDADDYWKFLVELTALGPRIRALPDAERSAVRTAIDEQVIPFTYGDSVALPARCWCGLAFR